MNRNSVIFSAVKFLELDSLPKVIPKNYKYHSDNCNCNKGLLPAKIANADVLINSVDMYKAKLNNPVVIDGFETTEIDCRKHKVICKICNHFIRF